MPCLVSGISAFAILVLCFDARPKAEHDSWFLKPISACYGIIIANFYDLGWEEVFGSAPLTRSAVS